MVGLWCWITSIFARLYRWSSLVGAKCSLDTVPFRFDRGSICVVVVLSDNFSRTGELHSPVQLSFQSIFSPPPRAHFFVLVFFLSSSHSVPRSSPWVAKPSIRTYSSLWHTNDLDDFVCAHFYKMFISSILLSADNGSVEDNMNHGYIRSLEQHRYSYPSPLLFQLWGNKIAR